MLVAGSSTPILLSYGRTDAQGRYEVAVPTGAFDVTFDPSPGLPHGSVLVANLIVSGDTTLDAVLPDLALNTPPVADAGVDQLAVLQDSLVQLDGSGSFDLDGDELVSFSWELTQRPLGSATTLSQPDAVAPSFVADVHGEYRAQLVVTDSSWASSDPDTVVVSFQNLRPVAEARDSQDVVIGETVHLDGTGSWDPNQDELSYRWSLVSRPAGSLAVPVSPTAPQTALVPDLSGTYVVSLTVNDGWLDSEPDDVTIGVVELPGFLITLLQEAIKFVNSLDDAELKNRRLRKPLVNKLLATIRLIEAGELAGALGKLRDDVLAKADGCSYQTEPDGDDWVRSCAAQAQLVGPLDQAAELLQAAL